MAGLVAEFTDDTFQTEVLGSSQPVLVDFWAPWCGPCRALAPAIEEMASDYQGKIRVGKVNIDDNPKVAGSFNVSAIPTVILFKNGEPVERFVGVQPKPRMSSSVDKHLA